jgi:hypothetical protein
MGERSDTHHFLSNQELLFLQKKKQKNSYLLRDVATPEPHPARTKSFLLLFFKKEALSYTSSSFTPG